MAVGRGRDGVLKLEGGSTALYTATIYCGDTQYAI